MKKLRLKDIHAHVTSHILDGEVSPEVARWFDLQADVPREPRVPSVMLDYGDEEPVPASQRGQRVDRTVMDLGVPFPEDACVLPFSEAQYEGFCDTFGHSLAEWEARAAKILNHLKVDKRQFWYTKQAQGLPLIYHLPHIRHGYHKWQYIYLALIHRSHDLKQQYNALLPEYHGQKQLQERLSKKLEKIEAIENSEFFYNVKTALAMFKLMDIRYSRNHPLIDYPEHLLRLYWQQGCLARGVLIGNDIQAHAQDLETLKNGDKYLKSIYRQVLNASFKNQETVVSLLSYFCDSSAQNSQMIPRAFFLQNGIICSDDSRSFPNYLRPEMIFKPITGLPHHPSLRAMTYMTTNASLSLGAYQVEVEEEQVSESVRLRCKNDLITWFNQGGKLSIDPEEKMVFKSNISLSRYDQDSHVSEDYYERMMQEQVALFIDYAIAMGCGKTEKNPLYLKGEALFAFQLIRALKAKAMAEHENYWVNIDEEVTMITPMPWHEDSLDSMRLNERVVVSVAYSENKVSKII